jgi:hypothetical protein
MGVDELSLNFGDALRVISTEGQARMDAARAVRFDGETFIPELDGERLTGQLDRVWGVMKDGAWWTLEEISVVVQAPTASVSARLRDLRKERFGGWTVERRRRGLASAGIFEYRVVK